MTSRVVIEAGRTARNYWRDLWRYRELLYVLTWRDLQVRYKQTVLGVAWALLRPLLATVVFTLVFGRLAKLSSGGVPYPLLVLVGMLPWQLFSTAVGEASASVVNNAGLISKVYFPRLIVPASAIGTSFVDFLISLAILAGAMAWYRVVPGAAALALPLFTLLVLLFALGAGLWLAALNVRYRDFRYVVPFLLQLGLYVSPVGFDSSVVPERLRTLYALNPMVGIIDGFRWALLGGAHQVDWPAVQIGSGVVALLLLSGLWYFRRTENDLADVL